MGKLRKFAEGDLVTIARRSTWTLCLSVASEFPRLRECPVEEFQIYTDPAYQNIFKCVEGKAALIVYVARNRLGQPLGYRVLIEGIQVFCKSIVAAKYFKLAENPGDESR